MVSTTGAARADRRLRALAPLAFVLALGAQPVAATTAYGDFAGTRFDYLGVQETSSFHDPEPLLGGPLIVGDSLVFTPTAFRGSAAGAGGVDQTGTHLQATITATGAAPIASITIEELGEVDLSGAGAAASGAFVSMSGIVTVLETAAGGPCVGPACQIGFTGTFTPSDRYGLPANPGQTVFRGNVLVDLRAAGFPDVTRAFLSFGSNLVVSSEAGTTASVQARPTIIVKVTPGARRP